MFDLIAHKSLRIFVDAKNKKKIPFLRIGLAKMITTKEYEARETILTITITIITLGSKNKT